MRWIPFFAVFLVLASTCCATRALAATSLHPDTAVALASADVAAAALVRESVPGIQIAIIRAATSYSIEGMRMRDVGSRQPVESNTLFEIGSITKPFTAAAILQLKERG